MPEAEITKVVSMTGFAQARLETGGMALTMTLKAVNHRFLDLRWQVPPDLEAALPTLEKVLRGSLRRGHIDIRIQLEAVAGGPKQPLELNRPLIDAYLAAHAELRSRLNRNEDLRERPLISDLLRLPGLLAQPTPIPVEIAATALPALLADALGQLAAMRRAEGAALDADLRARIGTLRQAAAQISAQSQSLESALLDRLRQRMAQLLVPAAVAPERLLQEAALLAERSDISEELTRIAAHTAQFLAILDAGGEVGKKLDFLAQELNREVNTLLSKTSSASGLPVSALGLEMKSELEKVREQVQNLE